MAVLMIRGQAEVLMCLVRLAYVCLVPVCLSAPAGHVTFGALHLLILSVIFTNWKDGVPPAECPHTLLPQLLLPRQAMAHGQAVGR